MANQSTRALAPHDPRQMKVTGAFRDAQEVTSRLQHAAKHYHLVSPATACGAVPEGCSIALSTVLVDIENETYDVGGKRGLGKPALDKIAAAAGISWDARLSGRVDDGSDSNYCTWRAVGQMRHLDGSLVQLVGNKEMDLRVGSPQLDALFSRFHEKHAKWEAGGRKGYEPKAPDAQVREMRLHIMAHAESKARLRAIRSLGVRSAYKPEELTKPFVVAKIMWTGQSDDPELRRAFALKAADAMLGGTRALYGEAPAPLPPASHQPQLGARKPPPVDRLADDDDVVDAPPPAPSEPRATQGTPATSSSGDGPVARFGRSKGQPLMDTSDDDLDWYHTAVKASVDDPAKAKFRASNEAHLKEVLAELERRNGVPADAAAEAAVQGADQFDPADDENPF